MSHERSRWSYLESPLERSFLWSLAVTSIPVFSGFVVFWMIARWGGSRVVGIVSWTMAFATALLIVGKFGLDLAASRMASEYGVKAPGRLRSLYGKGIGIRLAFTVGVGVLALAFAAPLAGFFKDESLIWPIRVAALIVLCASVFEFNENFLIGLNRMGTVYNIRGLTTVVRIALTAGLLAIGAGATAILGGYCAAWMVGIALYGVLLFRYLPEKEPSAPPTGMVRRLFALSVSLAVSTASVTIYSQMDKLMLGYFTGVEEVGQFTVARSIAEVSLFPVFALGMVLRPALAARFARNDLKDCAQVIRNTLLFGLGSGVLFSVIFAVMAVPLVTLVFSEQFRYSGELMMFFIWVILLRSIGTVILPALVAAERTRMYAYLTTVSAGINFFLNLVLIPLYQSRGAILATVVSYGVLLAIGLREVFVTYGVRIDRSGLSQIFRTILAGAVSGGAMWLLVSRFPMNWDVFLWAGVLAALYVGLILLFRVWSTSGLVTLYTNLRKTRG